MSIKDQLRTDMTAAMKAKDTTTLRTLRMVLAAIGAAEVAGDSRAELDDDQVLAVLAAEAKKRVEAADAYAGGGRDDRETRAWLDELAELLDIGELLDKPADQLSGGQKQRAAIGRALMNRPDLVLADEPTGNLDTQNAAAVNDLFRRVHRTLGTTFAIVTHDAGMAEIADRVIEVSDGTIARDTGSLGAAA